MIFSCTCILDVNCDLVCVNGGTCNSRGDSGFCLCSPGWTGQQCELGKLKQKQTTFIGMSHLKISIKFDIPSWIFVQFSHNLID